MPDETKPAPEIKGNVTRNNISIPVIVATKRGEKDTNGVLIPGAPYYKPDVSFADIQDEHERFMQLVSFFGEKVAFKMLASKLQQKGQQLSYTDDTKTALVDFEEFKKDMETLAVSGDSMADLKEQQEDILDELTSGSITDPTEIAAKLGEIAAIRERMEKRSRKKKEDAQPVAA